MSLWVHLHNISPVTGEHVSLVREIWQGFFISSALDNHMRKIAIVGSAPSSRDLAPFDDDTWDIWALNYGYNYQKRWDTYFELHNLDLLPSQHIERLALLKCPLYIQTPHKRLPNAKLYPLQKVIDYFNTSYYTNSIAYMLALAIMEEPEEIGIYGVDMAVSPEYRAQRPSCELFIGIAQGKGIKVTMPREAQLCKTAVLYAFNISTGDKEFYAKTRKQQLLDHSAQIQADITKTEANFSTYIKDKSVEHAAVAGALEELENEAKWETL